MRDKLQKKGQTKMKIGDIIYVAVQPDGTILGDGDSLMMSESREYLEENLKGSEGQEEMMTEFFEEINQCKISDIKIEEVLLVKFAKTFFG